MMLFQKMPHFISTHRLLCLFVGISASFPIFAEKQTSQKWYEVEVILFSTPISLNYSSEKWQSKTGYPNLRNNIELYSLGQLLLEEYPENLPQYFLDAEFENLDKKNLSSYVKKITRSPDYRLILHKTWRQPLDKKAIFLTDEPDTTPILSSPQKPEKTFEINDTAVEKTAEDLLLAALLEEEKDFSQPLSHLPFFISELDQIEPFDATPNMPTQQYTALSYEGPPQHLAYGNITLSKGRYLHMKLDFFYRGEPYSPKLETHLPEEVLPELQADRVDNQKKIDVHEALSGFRIKDSKRVRLNKVYYFDHPLFGAIVRVIRHTPAKN